MIDLNDITNPDFLKELNEKELISLAADIRKFLIDNVSKTGGHLASNLGIVEITIALHYVFDSPKDKFLFDVGHQAYVHKILTGRANKFDKLRKFEGLSGYINRAESEHDCYESGHSSTSISTQIGMLFADSMEKDSHVISIIGDSSIANGVAFEGLNFGGAYHDKAPIIILNDNKMGISKSVGSFSKSLAKIRRSWFWIKLKSFMIKIFPSSITNFFHQLKRGIKGFLQRDNIFEDLGFDYFGPYNGNDMKEVISALQKAKKTKSPCVIHLITQKGKGYELAEKDDVGVFHGVEAFDPMVGLDSKKEGISFSEVISRSLLKIRSTTPLKVITPAMVNGSKLNVFMNEYPNDVFDVGIAEEHAASMASGLALANNKVCILMYSTFAQRAYDYFLNDISRNNLPVVIGIDRAGIVGEDGATHQGIYDISMFNSMPNIKISMPFDSVEAFHLLNYAFKQSSPMVVRYPKANAKMISSREVLDESWYYLLENQDANVCVISYGPDLLRIKDIVEENNLKVSIINALFIKPLDMTTIKSLNKYNKLFIYEQVVKQNSLGSSVIYELSKLKYSLDVTHMAIDCDTIIKHGDITSVLNFYHLGDEDILKELKNLCD